jgi:hypothetical protein
MTVIELHPGVLSRDQRKAALERLGEDWAFGTPGDPGSAALLVAGAASGRLSPERQAGLWQVFLDELGRHADWLAGARNPFDLEPERAEARAGMALADLLDGTDFYAREGEL